MSTIAEFVYTPPPLPIHHHEKACACIPGVAYLRVSKEGGRGADLISDDLQLTHIDGFCRREGVRIVDVIPDVDRTGREFSKRRVQEMIDAISAGKYRAVVLWEWSRWGRNAFQSKLYLARITKAGGTVRAATQDVDMSTAFGKFTLGLFLEMAEFYSNQIQESWISTHNLRRGEGLPHNSYRRFGYQYTKGQGYAPLEGEAEVLAIAYRDFVQGTASWEDIAYRWGALGFRTVRGGEFDGTAVCRIMENGFAAGYIREHSKPTVDDRKASQTLESYDVWRPGAHQPIISEDLWQAFCAKRAARKMMPKRTRNAVYPLSGLLVCAKCGARLTSTTSNTGKKAWACPTWRRFANHISVKINHDLAEEAVLAWIEAEIAVAGDVDEQTANWAAQTTAVETNLKALAEEETELKRKRRRLADDLLSDLIDREDAAAIKAEYDERLARIGEERGLAKLAQVQLANLTVHAFTTLRDEWAALPPSDLREALSHLASFVVHPGKPHCRLEAVPRYVA